MVVRWSERRGNAEDFALPLLSELVNKEFSISNVMFGQSQYGEYAVVTTNEFGVFRTSSTVLLRQLHEIQNIIAEEQDSVLVTLVKFSF